jgi:hypothetical protein
MNGVTQLETDDSDFVEVDPTGRYGRVSNLYYTLFYQCFVPSFLFIMFCFSYDVLSLVFFFFFSTMKFSVKELPRQFIEHLMSIKGLKLLGIKSNYMISYKTPKISKGFTVKFIFSRH